MEAANSIAKKKKKEKKSLFLPLNVEYSDLMIIAHQGFLLLSATSPFLREEVMESSLKHTNRISSL